MRNVCRWLTEIAGVYTQQDLQFTAEQLAESGEHFIPALTRRGFENMPLVETSFGVRPVAEVDESIQALRWLGANYHNLNGVQLAEVMTTAHFSAYFTDALSRAFYTQYMYRTGQWQRYVFMDTAPDFRDIKRFRMEKRQNMQRRREKAEQRETNLVLSSVAYAVEEYAEDFNVSWRAILNDDLGEIRRVPEMMVQTTGEWLDSFVSALYDNATTQAALVALGALYAGTGRLTEANLTIAINAMFQRTDSTGRQMNIGRFWLVIPPVLVIAARKILESTQVAGSANNDVNVVQDYIAGLAIDPYITINGADQPWYLVADPSEIPAISLARLQGWPGPVVAMKRSNIEVLQGSAPAAFLMGSFESGDIEYMVEDVVGGWDDSSYVGVTDYRGIYYSSGTTS